MPDTRVLVAAISEAARRRDMTHIVLSPETYAEYAKKLTKADKAKGVLHSRAYNAAFLVVPGAPDAIVLSFNSKSRSAKVANLLAFYRAEQWKEARTMMKELCQQPSKFIAVTRLPVKKGD